MPAGTIAPANEKNFHIYEINIDGTNPRQITQGIYDDVDPISAESDKVLGQAAQLFGVIVRGTQHPVIGAGTKTIEAFAEVIAGAGTIVWNGPMGVFERDEYAAGTRAAAQAVADATAAGAVSVIGGGDSAAAVEQMNLAGRMTHVSTGGGASLTYLEGKPMPPIEVLDDK